MLVKHRQDTNANANANANGGEVRFDPLSRLTGESRYPEAAGYEFVALDTGFRR